MNSFIKETLKKFAVLFFPKRCDFCGCVVAFDEMLCSDCNNLDRIQKPICIYCGSNKEDCCCKQHKSSYKGVVAPYYYEGIVIDAIHNFKFNEQPLLSHKMAREIAISIKNEYDSVDFDFVTCVPLSKGRENQRGYNQAYLLAEKVSREIDVPYSHLLQKVRRNTSQRKLNPTQRKVNVYGVYDILPDVDVSGKTILLIDDVKTTGATLGECAKMLKLNGAKDVFSATLAVVRKNT